MKCLMESGEVLIEQVLLANRFWTRLIGLLGRNSLDESEALLIEPCNSVHTLGMRFPIAVIFLNHENNILKIIPEMQPGKLSPMVKGSRRVLELNPKRVAKLKALAPGQQLKFSDSPHV